MDAMQNRSFNSLVKHFLGVGLPDRLSQQISYPDMSIESRQFALRMLSLMQRASYPAGDFTPLLMRALSTVSGASLPSAWNGRIPPITMPGRHRKLDMYVASQAWPGNEKRSVFLDLGCGFPPITTLETAGQFPEWTVFGVDREFTTYVLYDADGHYACFNRDGQLVYLQTRLTSSGSALNDDPKAARVKFQTLFDRMRTLLPAQDAPTSTSIEHRGNRLDRNPIRDYESSNLTFIQMDFQKLDLPPAQVIRCMNVLLYFNAQERKKLLVAMGRLLDEGGMLIAGFNHFLGSGARYAVYRKAGTQLIPVEFAFSMDNLRPVGIAPWYTLHDDDPEAGFLADLTSVIRSDQAFWPTFNHRVDHLLADHGVCRRDSDGSLCFPKQPPSPEMLIDKLTALWKQIDNDDVSTQAAEALDRAGFQSWINPVGDIAVHPPATPFPAVDCLSHSALSPKGGLE